MFPVISVLMSVYNGEADIRDSVESILNQTYENFELVIINDGSTDGTAEILKEYAAKDSRVIIVHQENSGLTKALNKGLSVVSGQYIARQDVDDISYPDRLQKQLALIEGDPAVVLVGGNCDDVYDNGFCDQWGGYDEAILQTIAFVKTPFPHSSVMMRRDICDDLEGYDESFKTAQDMELWMRFAMKGKLAMVSEPIIQRKISSGSISHKRRWRQFYDAMRARVKHNQGFDRLWAVYYGVRSFVIGLLPPSWIEKMKKVRS